MFLFLKPALNIFKKVALVVIVYFAVISLFSYFINKDKVALTPTKVDPIKENRKEIYKVINDKELNKTQSGKLSIFVYRGMMCSMMGEGCTNNPADGDKNFGKSGLGFISNLITLPFMNPPASGIAWTYSGLANAGFVPKTMAAEGIGMGSIQPFAKIWKIFRDVAYLLLVIVLIVIGFMVMFRAKINPQTVISVENSLPKIIIALILITFSFAIAGFMIDLMYLLIAIITSVLSPVYTFATSGIGGGTGPTNLAELQKYYLTANPGALYKGVGGVNHSMWGTLLWGLPSAILSLIPWLGATIKVVVGSLITFFFAKYIDAIAIFLSGAGPLQLFIGPLEATTGVGAALHLDQLTAGLGTIGKFFVLPLLIMFIFQGLVPIFLGLLIWFSLIFVFFRIFMLLINSYIKILLSIIFSPIYLLFEAVPGQTAFTNWLKNLAGELITFPLVVGIFVLGSIIVDSASSGNLVQFPFMWGIDPKSYGYIVGMMLFFGTPELVKAVRQIFIPKPGIFDAVGPGVFFGGVGAATGGAMSGLSQIGSVSMALGAFGVSGFLQPLVEKFGLKRTTPPSLSKKIGE